MIHGRRSASAFAGNVIQGNYIGTNASGTAALGNRDQRDPHRGRQHDDRRNRPGRSQHHLRERLDGIIIGGRSTGTVVQGNLIGTAADGTTALGNGLGACPQPRFGHRRVLRHGTTIGGTAPGAANTIAYSTGSPA